MRYLIVFVAVALIAVTCIMPSYAASDQVRGKADEGRVSKPNLKPSPSPAGKVNLGHGAVPRNKVGMVGPSGGGPPPEKVGSVALGGGGDPHRNADLAAKSGTRSSSENVGLVTPNGSGPPPTKRN